MAIEYSILPMNTLRHLAGVKGIEIDYHPSLVVFTKGDKRVELPGSNRREMLRIISEWDEPALVVKS